MDIIKMVNKSRKYEIVDATICTRKLTSTVNENWLEYNDRLDNGMSRNNVIGAITRANKEIRVYADKIGEQVFYPIQIRTLACLLGFVDLTKSSIDAGPSQISLGVYKREIEDKIPESSRVDLRRELGILKNRPFRIVFRRSGVEVAFGRLSKEDLLLYTQERFQQAVEKL